MINILGIAATIIILISMCFPTTYKGVILMRATNIIGSICFVIYALIQNDPDYAVAILNIILTFVNTYHLIILIRRQINNKKKQNN